VDGTAVLLVHSQAVIGREGLPLRVEPETQQHCEIFRVLAAYVPHNQEHSVLHGVVGDAAEVSQAAGKEDVDVRRDDLELAVHVRAWIIGCEWSEQYRILQCET